MRTCGSRKGIPKEIAEIAQFDCGSKIEPKEKEQGWKKTAKYIKRWYDLFSCLPLWFVVLPCASQLCLTNNETASLTSKPSLDIQLNHSQPDRKNTFIHVEPSTAIPRHPIPIHRLPLSNSC